jgi:hypothetical protein
MINLNNEVYWGQRAQELQSNPVFEKAIAEIEKQFIEELKASPVRDVEGQHKIVLMLKVLEKIEKTIQSYVDTGKMARIQLQDKEKKFGIF